MKTECFIIFSALILACPAVTLEKTASPGRIVSLVPAITEQIYLLGASDRLYGVTIYCNRPPEAQSKEKVGTITETNIEKIIELKPDLVITSSLTNPKTKEKLKRLNINALDFTYAGSYNEICSQFLRLGSVLEKTREAESIVSKSKMRLARLLRETGKHKRQKVFIQVGARPLWTVPGNNYINELIKLAGGINIATGSRTGMYSIEQVITKNPDIIIISGMGMTENEGKMWEKYTSINAVKKNNIYEIDSSKLCSPTPETYLDSMEEIIKIIRKAESK